MTLLAKTAHVRHLDRRAAVLSVFVVALAIYLWGELRSPYGYSDPQFVIGYLGTEIWVTGVLLLATWKMFPAADIGLRLPRWGNTWQIAPLLILILVSTGAWVATRLSLPAEAVVDNQISWWILRTTALVGLNEEWIFRGLLLAAFSRWWGLKRGALMSLAMFGAFHLMNMAVGVPLAASLMQVCATMLVGSVFLMAALGCRSLLPPMVGHAVYDFFVIDCNRLLPPDGSAMAPVTAVVVVGALLGVGCIYAIFRLKDATSGPKLPS